MLSILSSVLGKEYTIHTALHGQAGLELFKNIPFSLVLLDLDMPVMNGIETLKKMREMEEYIKVLIMTGNSCHEWAAKCADMRIQGYLEKPFNPQMLLERVNKLVSSNNDDFYEELWGRNYRSKIGSFSPLVYKAITIINENFRKNMGRNDVSSCLKVSPEYLSRVFSKECGLQLCRYINRRRIHESKKLLAKGDESKIKHVAQDVGISDPNYFSRLFKSITSMTPGEYVNKLKLF